MLVATPTWHPATSGKKTMCVPPPHRGLDRTKRLLYEFIRRLYFANFSRSAVLDTDAFAGRKTRYFQTPEQISSQCNCLQLLGKSVMDIIIKCILVFPRLLQQRSCTHYLNKANNHYWIVRASVCWPASWFYRYCSKLSLNLKLGWS